MAGQTAASDFPRTHTNTSAHFGILRYHTGPMRVLVSYLMPYHVVGLLTYRYRYILLVRGGQKKQTAGTKLSLG